MEPSNSVTTWPVLIEDRVGEGTSACIAGRNNAIAVAPVGGALRPRRARLYRLTSTGILSNWAKWISARCRPLYRCPAYDVC
jgi:hypothetical protein